MSIRLHTFDIHNRPHRRPLSGHVNGKMKGGSVVRNRTPAHSECSNVTPVWLLCFWRLFRGEARGDYHAAWKALPKRLPRGVKPPTVEECANILYDHGLS